MTKKKRLPQTVEGTLAHFHWRYRNTIKPSELETLRENLFNECEYAFVNYPDQRRTAWCSHCREQIGVKVYTKHHDTIRCSHCGEALLVKHVWRGISRVEDYGLIYFYRRSVISPDIVTAIAVSVRRPWGEDLSRGYMPGERKEEIVIDSYYVFVPGEGGVHVRPVEAKKITTVEWLEQNGYIDPHAPRYELAKSAPKDRTRVYMEHAYGYGEHFEPRGLKFHGIRSRRARNCNWAGLKVYQDWDGLREAAEKSPLRYGLEEYHKAAAVPEDAYIKFLHWNTRYPAVEMVLKMGLTEIVVAKMSERYHRYYNKPDDCLNWRGKNLRSIFRKSLTKADKRYMKEHGYNIDMSAVLLWQSSEMNLTFEEAAILIGQTGGRWKDFADILNLKKTIAWLRRHGWIRKLGDYLDYISDCRQLGLDLTSKSVLHPKDIDTAHANTIRQIQYKENKGYEDAYQKRRRKLEKAYRFKGMGLMVVVPEHVTDYITEGKEMNNCVGGYIKRIAAGATDVVFVRSEENPGQSYITMEICNGRIIQARTHHNGPLDELGAQFVEAFRLARLEQGQRSMTA